MRRAVRCQKIIKKRVRFCKARQACNTMVATLLHGQQIFAVVRNKIVFSLYFVMFTQLIDDILLSTLTTRNCKTL